MTVFQKYLFLLLLATLSTFVYANGGGIPNREPDVISQPARLEDYYIYDKETKQWIWRDDYAKFKKKRLAEKIKNAELRAIAAKKQQKEQCQPCPVCPAVTKVLPGINTKFEIKPEKEKGFFEKTWDKTKGIWGKIKNYFRKQGVAYLIGLLTITFSSSTVTSGQSVGRSLRFPLQNLCIT